MKNDFRSGWKNASRRLLITSGAALCVLVCMSMYDAGDPPSVNITKDAVLINNEPLSKDWSVATAQRLLGKPDNVDGDENPNAMYDQYALGIRYWQRRAKEMGNYIEELKLFLTAETGGSASHSAFSGLLVLNDKTIDSTTTLSQLKTILSDWQQCNAYSSHTFEFMTRTNFLYVEYDETNRTLEWISVGKRTSIISGCD